MTGWRHGLQWVEAQVHPIVTVSPRMKTPLKPSARQIQALAPRYMQAFRCVGSDCVETCCGSWNIAIDERTYQRYQTIRIEPLAGMLRQHVQRHADPAASHGAFASISLKMDEPCPMLDADQLCSIQKTLGAEALSGTCNDYPRVFVHDGLRLGLCASLSCPEAARLALSDAAALDMSELSLEFNPELAPALHRRRDPLSSAEEPDLVRRHAPVLASVMDALLRLEHLSAEQALVYGGLLWRRVAALGEAAGDASREASGEAPGTPSEAQLEQVLDQFLRPDTLSRAADLVQGLPVPKEAQFSLLLGASQRFMREHGGRASFRALMDEVSQGLLLGQPLAVCLARYQEAESQVLRPFLAQHPHLLKNYTLNALQAAVFPRRGTAELQAEYMDLAVRVALIRFYLVGLAALRGPAFGTDDVVRAVYGVARNIEHNRRFMPGVMQQLQEQGALRLEVLATLLL